GLRVVVAEAIGTGWPADRPLFYRASCVDNVPGGLVLEDTIALAGELKARGVDVIDCSSGGMSGSISLSTAKLRPGFQVPLASAVRNGAGLPTVAVGAIIEPRQAEAILADDDADLIAIGRQALAEPHWLYRPARELGLANPHAVLPKYYGFYLERRAAVLEA